MESNLHTGVSGPTVLRPEMPARVQIVTGPPDGLEAACGSAPCLLSVIWSRGLRRPRSKAPRRRG